MRSTFGSRIFTDELPNGKLYCSTWVRVSSKRLWLAQWELTWQIKFNIDKCYTMQVGRKRHNILSTYTLHDHPLPITDSAKYLAVTISNDLKWNKHVSNITSKANSTQVWYLRRNLRLSSHTAYQALVRPHLEYASAVWDPYTHYNTHKLEMVQRGPVRLQSLAQYQQRHRNAQPAGVGPSGHA